MDRNAFLAFALSFLVLSLWMTWEAKNKPPVEPGAPVAEQVQAPEAEAPVATPPLAPPAGPAAEGLAASGPPAAAAAVADVAPEELVEVETALFTATLSTHGAGMKHFELHHYSAPRSEGGGPVVMIDRSPGEMPAFATPLTELGLGDLQQTPFSVTSRESHVVAFERTHQGVSVRKRFEFSDESYAFRMRVEVRNDSPAAVAPGFGVVIPESMRESSDFTELSLAALYDGSVESELLASFGQPGFLGGQPTSERVFQGDIAWTGAYSHYFLTALIPDVTRDLRVQWLATEPGQEALVAIAHPAVSIPTGTAVTREYTLYVGPKEADRLEAVGSQLDRTINLGWAWIAPLTKAFTWLLHACYSVIPNYGLAIILLTVLVRLVTAPLAAKQMRSMKGMGQLGPKIKELQEKYKDDRQQQSQEMMKLYREAGVNPLGGCLPMVLQIPVFIGLYYALQSSIDLRQAPFFLWIDDLSIPETLFTLPGVGWPVRVLPILMTLSMVLQQRMTPTTTMDPAQARMMMIVMPVMFFFMFYGFPSGLVLYWFVSNLLAIAQQVYLNRQMEPRTA